jgi:hypothetical protein
MMSNAKPVSRGFQGTVQGATLHDLIQMECLMMSARAVRVAQDGKSGRIYFAGGQIVHAETGTLTGEAALFELLTWTDGDFHFEDGLRPMENSIDRSWHGLLLEAAHLLDEAHANNPAMTATTAPTMTTIPLPQPSAEEVFRDPEVLQAVQYTPDGTQLAARADDADAMQSSFAYLEQIARLIGGALGAERLGEIHIASTDKKALCVIGEDDSTALIVTPKANIAALLKKLA